MEAAQVYVVRAMPALGHERRWCAQRPFTKEPREVTVVDAPKEHTMKDGKIEAYSYEVTPSELEEMRRDRYLAISIKGSPDADPLELNALKSMVQELEKKLVQAKKDHQDTTEELKAFRSGMDKQSQEQGALIAKLQQDLVTAHAHLSERGKKK